MFRIETFDTNMRRNTQLKLLDFKYNSDNYSKLWAHKNRHSSININLKLIHTDLCWCSARKNCVSRDILYGDIQFFFSVRAVVHILCSVPICCLFSMRFACILLHIITHTRTGRSTCKPVLHVSIARASFLPVHFYTAHLQFVLNRVVHFFCFSPQCNIKLTFAAVAHSSCNAFCALHSEDSNKILIVTFLIVSYCFFCCCCCCVDLILKHNRLIFKMREKREHSSGWIMIWRKNTESSFIQKTNIYVQVESLKIHQILTIFLNRKCRYLENTLNFEIFWIKRNWCYQCHI